MQLNLYFIVWYDNNEDDFICEKQWQRTNEDWFHKYSCRSSRASEIFLPASHGHVCDCGASQAAGRRGPSLRVFSPLSSNDWRWFQGHLPHVGQHQRTRSDCPSGICDGSSYSSWVNCYNYNHNCDYSSCWPFVGSILLLYSATTLLDFGGFSSLTALAHEGGGCLSNMWTVAWKISPKSTRKCHTTRSWRAWRLGHDRGTTRFAIHSYDSLLTQWNVELETY